MVNNYILIVRTLHGDPDQNITVSITGTRGQTEKLSLGKSQSYQKAFRDNQTDLFLLLSNTDVGQISQLEFHPHPHAKSKEWKYNHVMIINGTHVYQDIISEYSLLPSTQTPSVVNVSEPSVESQESIYYAFLKTGHEACSKEGYPKLSLFGNNQQHTEIDIRSSYRSHSPSANNNHALLKHQFDIFQWQDHHIGNIERIRLQLYAENKQAKCQWPIEWILVIHNGYSFSGRIMLNRTMKINRYLDIDLEQRPVPITGEYGDSFAMEKIFDSQLSPSYVLHKQFNATTEDVGRYYVFIKNMEGTNGRVYIEFHGDLLSSSGEQNLYKCENYPDHPFSTKHTDLFHIKAFEVGHIHSVSIRLDQSTKEHSLTLQTLFIIHNTIMYQFDLQYIILNKEQPKKEFVPLSHSTREDGKICYYLATHTMDKTLANINATVKVVVKGTRQKMGPVELKESLTNGTNPFERECIDLFHFEDDDIGDPISMTITLEPKGSMPHLVNSARCERMMLLKNGGYNSLWQLVGDLKFKEAKTISLPLNPRSSSKDTTPHSIIPVEPFHTKMIAETPPSNTIDPIHSQPKVETNDISNMISGDNQPHDLSMTMIEDHQKRHTFASSLYEAEQNYRELRRLLKKNNGSFSNEQKTLKESTNSTRPQSKRIL